MKSLRRLTLGLALGVFAVTALESVRAEPSASTGSKVIHPDALKLSPSADGKPATLNTGKRDDAGFSIPNTIDLGAAALRFDTDRRVVNSGTKVGIDSAQPGSFNLGVPAKKDLGLGPSYFGLTFTAPTH